MYTQLLVPYIFLLFYGFLLLLLLLIMIAIDFLSYITAALLEGTWHRPIHQSTSSLVLQTNAPLGPSTFFGRSASHVVAIAPKTL